MCPDDVLRASDFEREAAISRLRDATVEGRLSLEELADRTEAAYGATHRSELEQVVADLPAAPPRDASGKPPRRWFLGILGCDANGGPIRLAGQCRIVNIMGGADLDLSQATIDGGVVDILLVSIMGGSTIHVPHGVRVERSGFSLLGGDDMDSVEGPPPPPDAPLVRIRSYNLMGGSDIKRGKPKPWRWPWQRTPDPLPPPTPREPSPPSGS